MSSCTFDMLASALTERNPFMRTDQFAGWLAARRQAHCFRIEQIPFAELQRWAFEASTGNLSHATGKFFKIEGIWVETNFGFQSQWSQPIINQPEIGILGIVTRKFDGVLHFLMQAKMEPGNIGMVQLAPTVQATRSNFTRVHEGGATPYLEYFTDRTRSHTLVDVLQSEQGARFLRKRNRNILVETLEEVPVGDDYCWLTLGQIQKLSRVDNVVNMDARTVLSCIPFADPALENLRGRAALEHIGARAGLAASDLSESTDPFREQVLDSMLDTANALHTPEEIISWFTELKFRYRLDVERIPLKFVQDWVRDDRSISHRDGKYFSVIAVRVEADNREVASWTQPLVKPREEGIMAFVVKPINGVLHFLVQAKVEPGNFDVVEMAPTVQCLTGSYREVAPELRPPYLDYVLGIPEDRVRFRSMQSEEGGRFFREQNQNLIVEADADFENTHEDHYTWMTLNQIKEFIKYNNFVNVQARCLLSCLGLTA